MSSQKSQKRGVEKGIEGEIWTMEMECRAFPAILMATFLRDIDKGGGEKRRILKRIGKAAE